MSENIKAKRIAEQFGSFMESRKASKKAHTSFSDELINKVVPKEKKESLHFSERIRSARRMQPPQLGRSKKITAAQAQRLSSLAGYIQRSAKNNNVPVELICGVILQESGAQHKAVSHCGARGLMQLMPGTARRFGVSNSFDPQQNIEGGTRYLKWLLNYFKGDITLALAAYNSGEHNVEKYGNKIPPFRETQNYVPAVLGYTQSMIDIFAVKNRAQIMPSHARRV